MTTAPRPRVKLGLIGDNITDSKSPRLHELAGELLGRVVSYDRLVPPALDLDSLSFPALAPTRRKVLDALVELCSGDAERARGILGLPPGLAELVARNAELPTAPTARADHVYTGVLYDALGLPDLPVEARRRSASRVAVVSSLFGLVRPGDRIPAYRLSGDVSLPGLGPIASVWRATLDDVTIDAGTQLVGSVDRLRDHSPKALTPVHYDFRLDNMLFHP